MRVQTKRNNEMIKDLVKLANHLDSKGLRKEADYLDSLLQRVAQQNSGNAFNAAQEQGAEANAEEKKAKLTAEVQKTVDWFNNEVLPAISIGGSLNLRVPQDLLFSTTKIPASSSFLSPVTGSRPGGIAKVYIAGGQTITSLSQKVKDKMITRDSSGKVNWSDSSQSLTLGELYNRLEAFVIRNNLRVTMVSDVSEELDKVS